MLDTNCGADSNPSSLDGKLERLPKSLAESLDALHKDNFFKDFLGEKLLTAVKGVRKVNYILVYLMQYVTIIDS